MSMNDESFPLFSDFMQYPVTRIKEFVQKHDITTVYLPIDGTRRYFLLQAEYSEIDTVLSMKNPKPYFETSIQETIRIVRLLYSYGIKYVILLLMDDSAFQRPEPYLSSLIAMGILPIRNHPAFLQLFTDYDVRVIFGGFNERYSEINHSEVMDIISETENKTRSHSKHWLIFYTGTSPQQDYVRLLHKIKNSPSSSHNDIESIIRLLYKVNIPPISFSIFYNFPRDKILPPLLWGQGIRFYVASPSLSLNSSQVKQAIYYTALASYLIKDDYINYAKYFTKELLQEIKQYYRSVENELFGTELYHEYTFFSHLKR